MLWTLIQMQVKILWCWSRRSQWSSNSHGAQPDRKPFSVSSIHFSKICTWKRPVELCPVGQTVLLCLCYWKSAVGNWRLQEGRSQNLFNGSHHSLIRGRTAPYSSLLVSQVLNFPLGMGTDILVKREGRFLNFCKLLWGV